MLNRLMLRRFAPIVLAAAMMTAGTVPAAAQPQEAETIENPLQSWATLLRNMIDSVDFGLAAIWDKGSGYHDPNGNAESSTAANPGFPLDAQSSRDCEGRTCYGQPEPVAHRR